MMVDGDCFQAGTNVHLVNLFWPRDELWGATTVRGIIRAQECAQVSDAGFATLDDAVDDALVLDDCSGHEARKDRSANRQPEKVRQPWRIVPGLRQNQGGPVAATIHSPRIVVLVFADLRRCTAAKEE